MPAQITGLLGRLQTTIRQFTVAQRTLGLIGIAVLVLGAFALSSWLGRPTMSPLFANLSATDASAIVDHLDSEGVTYQLADGGTTILVPAEKVYPMRLAVAAAGLPADADGAGYSLLDDMGMTSSEFQQQVTYQRAVEGELAKTIGAMSGVEAATVRLALPEDSVFVSEKADPTASVFVKTKPGLTLDADKVQAIVHLVSAGIEGMSPTDVAVIDADGHVLSAVGGTPGNNGLLGNQTGDYEARVAANVQAMLDQVVGAGNAVVTVTADLDYDQAQRTTETYTATENLPPVSSATTLEDYTGTGGGAGGVLGSDGALTSTDGQTGTYHKESETVNNPINRVTEELTTAPGSVRRQSVSVVVSQDAGGDIDLTELQTAVVAAAGIDATRGDVVSVSRMPFDTTTAEAAKQALAAADAEAAAAKNADLIRTGAIAGVMLLALIIAVITAARRSRRARREAIDLGALEMIEARQAEVVEAAPAPLVLPPAPDPQADSMAAKREDVMALAAEQPAEVADVLRGWLAGSRR